MHRILPAEICTLLSRTAGHGESEVACEHSFAPLGTCILSINQGEAGPRGHARDLTTQAPRLLSCPIPQVARG